MASRVFTGGAALERHLNRIAQKVRKPGTLEVGFPEGATDTKTGLPMAYIAAIQEWGTTDAGRNHKVRIPPRPFFRTMIAENQSGWGPALGDFIVNVNYNVEGALSALGEVMDGQLKLSVRDWKNPPNAPATVKKKGFNDPLIDTGDMYRAIASTVKS